MHILPQKETIIATCKHKVGIPLLNAGPHGTQSFAEHTLKQETIIATHAWHFHVVSCTAFVGTAVALNGGMSTLCLRVAIIVSFHGCRFEPNIWKCRTSMFRLSACVLVFHACVAAGWSVAASMFKCRYVPWALLRTYCKHPSTCR